MLEKIDLSRKIKKKEYKKLMPKLRNQLYAMQKASWDAQIPVVILFEGWDAAGKGTSIQTLTGRLDPRGFKLYPIRAARTYEKKRPWLWRFWLKLPGRGEWTIFDRSWYGRVLVERMEKLIPESEWRLAYRDIVDFERTLADDGYLIIKFFLHISRQEQRRRFEKLTQDPLNAWHVAPEDWEHHRQYDEWTLTFEEMLERTDTEWGPWTIVEATNRRYTRVKIFQSMINALEGRLAAMDALPDPALWEHVSDDSEDEAKLAQEPDLAAQVEGAPEPPSLEVLSVPDDQNPAQGAPDLAESEPEKTPEKVKITPDGSEQTRQSPRQLAEADG